MQPILRQAKAIVAGAGAALGAIATAAEDGLTQLELVAALGVGIGVYVATYRTPNTPS